MSLKQREGVLVDPHLRLNSRQIEIIDELSRKMLEDPGLICYNAEATELFKKAGSEVTQESKFSRIKLKPGIIDKILETVPSKITLGARNPDNKLILDAHEPRVRFGSGSETNVWLDMEFENGKPAFKRTPGSIEKLKASAHLCDNLENLDFFIRNVNIQDDAVNKKNKDINKYLAPANNITKHIQAGLTDINALNDIIKAGHIIAGGEDDFKKNPVFSFITCVVKSPLQVVQDTAEKLIAISKRKVPVVITSCPMGGATGAFDEFGIVAQINAELLAGIAINQLASPGAPVLYGAVPVRTRLDNLQDMYGAPEFVQYNIGCAQMARHYGIPCYSTAGVGDTAEPGIQATMEKMLTLSTVPMGGAQYIHYAFGLLERTNTFCPQQAVLDNEYIGMIKHMLTPADINEKNAEKVHALMKEVMMTDHKTFVYNLPIPTVDPVYPCYMLEEKEENGGTLAAADRKYREISEKPRNTLDSKTVKSLRNSIEGILPGTLD